MNYRNVLPIGSMVADYQIQDVLGAGGFGVTYRALALGTRVPVAIKEYYPADLATRTEGHQLVPSSAALDADYRWGLNRFNEEARTLLQFRHANIVQLQRVLQLNNTAYMVLTLENAATLRRWCKDRGRPPTQIELDNLLSPLIDALEVIHSNGVLHRDVSPDNVLMRLNDQPVLIDFGSARLAVGQRGAMSAIVKHGFSPHEQYATASARQGPWSDIYALAATVFFLIAGKPPPQAINRLEHDTFGGLSQLRLPGYRPGFIAAIDGALALDYRTRPQTVRAWHAQLFAGREQGREVRAYEPQLQQFYAVGTVQPAYPGSQTRALPQPQSDREAYPPAAVPSPLPHPVTTPSTRRPTGRVKPRGRWARRIVGMTLLLIAAAMACGLALVLLGPSSLV
jgi:serine/threonine protein kinase